ncbi:hypothetical protein G7046_g4062 [Stylonectria norvegica]|nr:hypothetical protein G7046_g4062 [Stylonectria norvegica]
MPHPRPPKAVQGPCRAAPVLRGSESLFVPHPPHALTTQSTSTHLYPRLHWTHNTHSSTPQKDYTSHTHSCTHPHLLITHRSPLQHCNANFHASTSPNPGRAASRPPSLRYWCSTAPFVRAPPCFLPPWCSLWGQSCTPASLRLGAPRGPSQSSLQGFKHPRAPFPDHHGANNTPTAARRASPQELARQTPAPPSLEMDNLPYQTEPELALSRVPVREPNFITTQSRNSRRLNPKGDYIGSGLGTRLLDALVLRRREPL